MPRRYYHPGSLVRLRAKAGDLYFNVYGNDEREVKRVIKKIKTGKLKVDLQRYCVFRIKPDHTVEEFGMRINVVMAENMEHCTAQPRESQTKMDEEKLIDNNNTPFDH